MTKKRVQSGLLILLLVMICVFVGRSSAANASSAAQTQTKTEINVKGVGSVFVEPDIAVLTFGVLSEDVSADLAYAKTSSKINNIINAMKKIGIAQKDIKTLRINVYPNYSYNKDDNTSKIVGFYANTDLSITVRNLSIVGKVIDQAFKNGANTFSDLKFDITNSNTYYNQALAMALENAKTKAKVLADGLGITLGKPKSVTENSYVNNPPIIYSAVKVANESSASSQVESGSIEIKVEVSLTY